MRVKQVAERNEVNIDTVRYYTRIGLLTPKVNAENGYREYSIQDENRLRFILQAKSLGFSLGDIETFISESQSGQAPCPRVRELMNERIKEIEIKISKMQATYRQMQSALSFWQSLPDCIPTGNHVCHLIEKFSNFEVNNG